jgi:PUA domain protein
MKKWVLSRRDSIEMIEKVEGSVGVKLGLGHSAQANCEEPADGVVFVNFDELTFVQSGDVILPFLGSKDALGLFPSATVDEGAIKFLLNGADVMRPGIRSFDQWGEAGKIVVVKEEKKGRAIAVARSTVPSSEVRTMSKGVCLTNLQHVGDRFWTLHKQV